MSGIERVLDHVDSDLDAALQRLFAVLRIRSISTDPAFAAECRACADWHAADLASIGFDVRARDTPGHPIVVGHDRSAAGRSALFYGHYDVQPVDPIELWHHDPFQPFVETRPDGSRAMRGAARPTTRAKSWPSSRPAAHGRRSRASCRSRSRSCSRARRNLAARICRNS